MRRQLKLATMMHPGIMQEHRLPKSGVQPSNKNPRDLNSILNHHNGGYEYGEAEMVERGYRLPSERLRLCAYLVLTI